VAASRGEGAGPAPPGKGPRRWRQRLRGRDAAAGFILGALAWTAGLQVGIQALPLFRGEPMALWWALGGAVLAQTRARALVWGTAGGLAGLMLLVGYTPIALPAIRANVREDPLERVEALVVLSSGIQRDGDLIPVAESRLMKGLELVRQGYARRLILTRLPDPFPSYVPEMRRRLQALGLRVPLEETPAAANTHDEALHLAALARSRGWAKVILVTDAPHARRAGATFEKAGLPVLCAPHRTEPYDLGSLRTPGERLDAYRDWFREVIGYQVYRLRGWL